MTSDEQDIMAQDGLNAVLQNATASKDIQVRDGQQSQYISFAIGEDEYGVDILKVREIKAWSETTNLPNTPEFMRGVLNLRGTIVPIYDLRCRFGKGLTSVTPMHVIIIVQVEKRLVGMLVDVVSDIVSVAVSDIQPLPQMDRDVEDAYLSGMIGHKDSLIALLDVDLLFNEQSIEKGTALGDSADV